jgi:hypothetical protein
MTITTEQAEAYLTTIEDALTAAGLRPTLVDLHEHDEYDETGDTVPSAVLTWPAEHPLVDEDTHPHGLLVAWASTTGWEHASRRQDGSTEQPQHLAVADAAPDDLAAALLPIALGLPATVDDQAVIAAIREASGDVAHGTPTYVSCACDLHDCGGIGRDRINPDCPDHGQKNSNLMWHWAATCPAN